MSSWAHPVSTVYSIPIQEYYIKPQVQCVVTGLTPNALGTCTVQAQTVLDRASVRKTGLTYGAIILLKLLVGCLNSLVNPLPHIFLMLELGDPFQTISVPFLKKQSDINTDQSQH